MPFAARHPRGGNGTRARACVRRLRFREGERESSRFRMRARIISRRNAAAVITAVYSRHNGCLLSPSRFSGSSTSGRVTNNIDLAVNGIISQSARRGMFITKRARYRVNGTNARTENGKPLCPKPVHLPLSFTFVTSTPRPFSRAKCRRACTQTRTHTPSRSRARARAPSVIQFGKVNVSPVKSASRGGRTRSHKRALNFAWCLARSRLREKRD